MKTWPPTLPPSNKAYDPILFRGKGIGRILTDEDIDHYQNIVVALNETIRIMGEIDEVIDQHGGWPDAFITDPEELNKLKRKTKSGK